MWVGLRDCVGVAVYPLVGTNDGLRVDGLIVGLTVGELVGICVGIFVLVLVS